MNFWDQDDIPHKGWHCLGCYDTGGEEGDGYETCQMCGKEKIRYVHTMRHSDYANELLVGCICAEKMSDDYVGPKKKERVLRNKAARRFNWLKRKWSLSALGNEVLKTKKHKVVVGKLYGSDYWQYCIDNQWCSAQFQTSDAAKIAALDQLQILLDELT